LWETQGSVGEGFVGFGEGAGGGKSGRVKGEQWCGVGVLTEVKTGVGFLFLKNGIGLVVWAEGVAGSDLGFILGLVCFGYGIWFK
jgi:hypothetical protein